MCRDGSTGKRHHVVLSFPFERCSFPRGGSKYKALTGKRLVFWIGGRLWEVVAYEGWLHMEVAATVFCTRAQHTDLSPCLQYSKILLEMEITLKHPDPVNNLIIYIHTPTALIEI